MANLSEKHGENQGNRPTVARLLDAVRALAELRLQPAATGTHEALERIWQALDTPVTGAPLEALVAHWNLDVLERRILLVLWAPHVDAQILPLYRSLRGGSWWDGVDLALLTRLLADTWATQLALTRLLAPDAPLRRRGLVQAQPSKSSSLLQHTELTLPTRLAAFLLGEPFGDAGLLDVSERLPPGPPLERLILPHQQVAHARQLLTERAVLLFAGPPATGKATLARALGTALGQPVLRARLRPDSEASSLVALRLEAELAQAILLVEDVERLLAAPQLAQALLDLLDNIQAPVILTTARAGALDPALDRRVRLHIPFALPDPTQRELLWEALLPPDVPLAGDIDLPMLSERFAFHAAGIQHAVQVAIQLAHAAQRPLDMATLVTAAELQLRADLGDYALQTPTRRTLGDIVLPDDVMARVVNLLGACRHRVQLMTHWGFGQKLSTGLGIVALFDGPPGTGKTLCAEILGAELGVPVARIHLPGIVSKWVGETEQRIADLFQRARSTRAILLFDEADSLFGRRVAETQSASDRYANMEVNLILQEVERYDGVVILTTNLVAGLDPAILRRIQFRISFPEQDALQRGQIFRTLLPAQAPRDPDIDFAELGRRFDLPGGRIQNAVLRAGYLALTEQAPRVTMAHLVRAATDEAHAAGKVIRGAGPRRPTAENS